MDNLPCLKLKGWFSDNGALDQPDVEIRWQFYMPEGPGGRDLHLDIFFKTAYGEIGCGRNFEIDWFTSLLDRFRAIQHGSETYAELRDADCSFAMGFGICDVRRSTIGVCWDVVIQDSLDERQLGADPQPSTRALAHEQVSRGIRIFGSDLLIDAGSFGAYINDLQEVIRYLRSIGTSSG